MGVFAGPEITESGLVLALDAANTKSYPGSGTTWTDLSGRGNTGTLVNGVGYSASNGGALSFDGSNDYIDLGTSYSTLQPQTATLGVWYKQSSVATYYGICGWCFYGYGGGFLIDTGFNIPSINIGNGSWSSQLSSNITLSTSSYAYVVGTYDGASLKIYVNGILANSQNLVTTIGYTSRGFAIGGYYGSTSNSFPGNISIAQMYNRALTAAEISQNFNATRSRYGI